MTSPPPRRRAADHSGHGTSDRDRVLRLLFSVILLASIGGLGWWVWKHGLGGAPVRDSSPAWSHDGKRVAYSSEIAGVGEIIVASVTGPERTPITQRPDSDDTAPAFSPNGKSFAFASNRDGNYEIYVANASDGSAPHRLTNNPAKDLAPAWFPDGSRLVFMSSRGGAEFDLYQMNADGSNVMQLTNGGAYANPEVALDGVNLAFQKDRDTYVMNIRTKTLRRLTYEPSNGMHPTWSPDGRQIAVMTWRNGQSEIYLIKSDGTDPQLLVQMPAGDAVDPRWSPDGRNIAFVHVTGKPPKEQRLVYVVDVETKRLTRISR